MSRTLSSLMRPSVGVQFIVFKLFDVISIYRAVNSFQFFVGGSFFRFCVAVLLFFCVLLVVCVLVFRCGIFLLMGVCFVFCVCVGVCVCVRF